MQNPETGFSEELSDLDPAVIDRRYSMDRLLTLGGGYTRLSEYPYG